MTSDKNKTRVRAPIRATKPSKPGFKDSAAWMWLPAIAMAVTNGIVLAPSPAQATQTFSVNDTNSVSLDAYSPETVFHLNANTTISDNAGAAVYGTAASNWTFTNNGTISTTTGSAVYFQGAGNFVNYSDGRIFGSAYGLFGGGAVSLTNSGTITSTIVNGVGILGAGGTITNNSAALIAGANTGVFFYAAGAILTNSGTITGADASGVLLQHGGTVTNSGTAALINGYFAGVSVQGGAGTVTNEGTITATAVATIGVSLSSGGIVTNSGTGSQIYGTAYGVKIGGGGTLINQGAITATNLAGVFLTSGGSISNSGTAARISGGTFGIRTTYSAATVTNEGSIAGGSSAFMAGVLLNGGGSVSNSGTITGFYGVQATGTLVNLANSGTISGVNADDSAGVFLGNGGSIANNGTLSRIFGGGFGVKVSGAAGTVSNEGAITASGTNGNGIYLGAGGTVTNGGTANSAALISGEVYGIYAKTGAGIITNFGTITGSGTSSNGIYLGAGGSVSNIGTLSRISGATGVRILSGGTVSNQGTITGGTVGVSLFGGGTIANSAGATISGFNYGVVFGTGANTVTNAGSIAAYYTGMLLSNGGTVINTGTASVITALNEGVRVNGSGGFVTNEGGIYATGLAGTGIFLNRGGIITNGGTANSTAVVSGAANGIYAGTNASFVTNFGTVRSNGSAGNGILLAAGGTLTNQISGIITSTPSTIANTAAVRFNATGLLTNLGTISGENNGVVFTGGGTIINSGSIAGTEASSGAPHFGIKMTNGGSVTNNAGAHISGQKAVYVFGAPGTVTNFGTIASSGTGGNAVYLTGGGSVGNSGTASLISGNLYGIHAKASAVTVTNEGNINGGTGLGQAGVRLDGGGSINNNGTISGYSAVRAVTNGITVTNTGTLNGGTAGTFSAGVFLEDGGTVNNNGTAALITANAFGIHGGSFAATINNNGTIQSTSAGFSIGISLASGYVGNASTGTISAGYDGVTFLSGPGTVANAGTIRSTAKYNGVLLNQGGTAFNAGTASLISAVLGSGVKINNAAGVVVNQGIITATGAGSYGIYLEAGGSITNSGLIHGAYIAVTASGAAFNLTNTGTITSGYMGVSTGAGGSITNSGSIHGASYGVSLKAGGTVINSGTITSGGTGLAMTGGTLTNTGLIDGDGVGVFVTGGTVINSGTIKDAISAGIVLLNGAVVTNNSSGSLIGTIGARIGGASTLINYGTITAISPGIDAVRFTSSGGQLILGTGTKITGDISGGGTVNTVRLIGSGTLASTITNFGAGSSVTVASGANWIASGTWTMPTLTNSGTLQPGVAGTALNVTGNFTQTSTGVLKSVLTSSGGASLLNITGTATLAGSVAVTPPTSITGTTKYTVLTASGGVSGTFASVSGGTALLVPSLSYDPNNAFVTLTQQAVAAPAPTTTAGSSQSENENAFAKAFDAAYAANPVLFAPLLASLNQIKTRDDLNAALNQLTGENSTAISNMIVSEVNEFLNQFQQHSQGTMGVTEVDDPWITGFIQSGNFRGNGNANELRETAWGFTAGADHVVTPGFRIGVMGGMGQQRSNTGGGAGSAKVWYEQLASTADYSDGNWYLNGLVGMSLNHGSTTRAISLPGITATALGHLTSTQFLASGQAGYGIPLDAKFTLVPFVGIDISTTNQDAYNETGAGLLNLAFAGRTISYQRSLLGARLKGAELDVGGLSLNTELKMGWAHQFAAVNPAAVAAFASVAGPSFTVTGAPLARDAGVIGLGLSTPVASNASIHLRYDGEFSGISSSNTVSFGLAVDW